MRAVVVEEFGGADAAQVMVVDDPQPGPEEVVVEVAAAGINPVDTATRKGLLHEAGLHQQPPVRLGWDVAGRVRAVGAGVRRIRPGQPVIGLSDRLNAPTKSHGELVTLDEVAVSGVPAESDLTRLSILPLAGLTAWQALKRTAVHRGQTLLVTGAAGAVGSLIAQLARLEGVAVIGAGREQHRERIEAFDATFVDVARLAEDVREAVPSGVDAAIDTAVLGAASLDAVRSGGRHVSLVVTERPAPLRGIESTSVAVRGSWRQLTILASLHATGALCVPEPSTYPLTEAAAAYAAAEEPANGRTALTT